MAQLCGLHHSHYSSLCYSTVISSIFYFCLVCFCFYLKSFCVRSQKEMVFESISSDENCLLRINFIFDEAGGCFLKKNFDPHQTRMVLISFFFGSDQFQDCKQLFFHSPGSYLNKTGLQPVLRPVERVHYLEGWSRGLLFAGKKVHFANAPNEPTRSFFAF